MTRVYDTAVNDKLKELYFILDAVAKSPQAEALAEHLDLDFEVVLRETYSLIDWGI